MNIADSLFLAGAVLSVLFDLFLTVLLFLCTFLNVFWHGLRNKEKVIHVKSNMHVHLARCDRFLFNFYKCCAHCSPPFINDDMSTLLPHKNGELFAKCKACHVTFSSSHHFFFPSFPYSPCLFCLLFTWLNASTRFQSESSRQRVTSFPQDDVDCTGPKSNQAGHQQQKRPGV